MSTGGSPHPPLPFHTVWGSALEDSHPASCIASRPAWIMGILNCTPDSFSDGGRYLSETDALARGDALIRDGADVLDIGGESTRPGSTPVAAEEELRRIEPVVRAFAGRVPVSVDTYKSVVARRCLELGARTINDVSALRADPEMARTCAELGASVVMMYSKESGAHPHASAIPRAYSDLVDEIAAFLLTRVEYAVKCGVREDRIMLDPGMGRFVSNEAACSWQLLRRMPELCARLTPFPVLICTSRKGFLGGPLTERDPLSQLTALHAVRSGVSAVRTHNVAMMSEFLDASQKLRL